MDFSWTGEVHRDADKSYVRICRYIEKKFLELQKGTSIEHFDAKLNFCPILMNENLREHFPARSSLSKKNRVYYCCPQLDYEIFLTNDIHAQLNNCIDELLEAAGPLKRLGASKEQVADYVSVFEQMRR